MISYDLTQNFTIGNLEIRPVHVRIETLRPIIAAHRHSHSSYEIHYTAQGAGTAIIGDVRYPVKENTLYVTGPDVEHTQLSDPANPVLEYCLYLHCRVRKGKTTEDPMSLFQQTRFWYGEDTEGVADVLRQILKEQERGRRDAGEMTEALLRQVVILLNRTYRKKESQTLQDAKMEAFSEARLYPAVEDAFFYGHGSLELDDVARMLNLSHRQTQRFLLEHYGMTFSQKRFEARMAAATQMLVNTDMTIGDIAEKVGFSSGEHFSNAFRRKYQMSPSAYRKMS